MLFHDVEITVGMQQDVPAEQAERPDDHVDALAHGHALGSQAPVVAGSRDRHFPASEIRVRQFHQYRAGAPVIGIARKTLEDFRKDQIPDQNLAGTDQSIQCLYFARRNAVEEIHAHGCVDEHREKDSGITLDAIGGEKHLDGPLGRCV